MDAYQPYLLPAICLVWCIAGLLTVVWPDKALEKRLSARKETADSDIGTAPSDSEIARLRRRIRMTAGVWCAVGLCGVLMTGLVAGVVRNLNGSGPGVRSAKFETFLIEYARHARRETGVVGMVVGAVAGDEVGLVGVGQKTVTDPTPPDGDTVYEIGSISKVFTGLLLADAVERGEATLDSRVQEYLPDGVSLPADIRDTITLRHLTTHSSGFPRLPANFASAINAVQITFGGDPHRRYVVEQFHEAVRTVELEFEPGSQSVYSNFGVSLLGEVLATRAGQPYEQLMQMRVAQPLGMTSTAVKLDDAMRSRLAPGYRSVLQLGPGQLALKSATWDMPDHYAGAGGIRSTGKDMLRFLQANMGKLDSSLAPAMSASHEALMQMEPSLAIGMNWLRRTRDGLGPVVLWHNGATGGYRSFLAFTEDGRFGVVVLANTAVPLDDVAVDLLEVIEQDYLTWFDRDDADQ
ncbi:MAG: serine hydrolase domain-containing protein [Pseudomonadota bacterium]